MTLQNQRAQAGDKQGSFNMRGRSNTGDPSCKLGVYMVQVTFKPALSHPP